jgi:hypothetical protein
VSLPPSSLSFLPPPPPASASVEEVHAFTRAVLDQARVSAVASSKAIRRNRALLSILYVLMFLVGLAAAVAAVVKGLVADTAAEAGAAAVVAGLSAASFFSFFLARPLESLERNSIYTQWLTATVTSHWLRLAYLSDPATAGADLEEALRDLVRDLRGLARQHAEAVARAPQPHAPSDEAGA